MTKFRSKDVDEGFLCHSSAIDFSGDLFERSHETAPGYYIMFSVWKGPFDSKSEAIAAYEEWCFEARCS